MTQDLRITGPHDCIQGSGGQYSLENAARIWMVLWRIVRALGLDPASISPSSSSPLRISFKHGPGSSPGDLTSNPRFYEKVMGWPTDWTAPGAQVTEFAAWLRLSRGRLSELLTIAATDPDA